MKDKPELTGMASFKHLLDRDEKGESKSKEEREWFEAQKKASLKYRGQIVSGGQSRDHLYGSLERKSNELI
ncbi:hypothetical protein GCM10028819_33040 [Spirosoma humi]